MDFGCYNALWSLWYLGKPNTVFATANHLRPDRFPKVEDNVNLVLTYDKGVGIFEGSWDLPRSYQDLEIFGWGDEAKRGSVYMTQKSVTMQHGKNVEQLAIPPLEEAAGEPIAYMISRMRAKKPIEGLTAVDINVDVIHVIDVAKKSVRSGKPEKFE